MITKHLKYLLQLVLVFTFTGAWAGAYEDFFRAIGVDDSRAVNSLLARGFDPNAVDERGQNGLFLALRSESYQVAAALLAHPDTKFDAANPHGETPLMMAALRGRVDWTRRLLDRGGAVNRDGWTPLHYAASGPETQVIELLLERGAAIDARSPNGTTPLMMAARYGSEASALLLLARGADPAAKNEPGMTAADFARSAGRESLAAKLQPAR